MSLVDAVDGQTRKKKKGDVEVLNGGEDDMFAEDHVVGTNMQFESALVEDVNGQNGAKKKKKKKKKVKKAEFDEEESESVDHPQVGYDD